MKRTAYLRILLVSTVLVGARYAGAGQVPGAASNPDIPISHHDRVYAAEQFSNTVSVTETSCSALSGSAIRCRRASAPFIAASCWCTAWVFRPIIAPLQWSRSARTP
jgi:hypothetical protein